MYEEFNQNKPKLLIPYTLPLLQTSLTISVYTTVSIAICGWLYIRPVASNSKSREQSVTATADHENFGTDYLPKRSAVSTR